MADFNFTVDTTPMANQINSVSHHVDGVTASVVAMKTAVISAEKDAANKICGNVNRGFFSMMQAQITQKIAQCTSKVESKLFELQQESQALKSIQTRMQRDYNMISARYFKLFNALNANLKTRIYELDKPTILLATKDMSLKDNRINKMAAFFNTNQTESVLEAQNIGLSKAKKHCADAIEAIGGYLNEMNKQNKHFDSVITNIETDYNSDILLPVIYNEYTSDSGSSSIKTTLPTTGINQIDKSLNGSVDNFVMKSVMNNEEWKDFNQNEYNNIASEFNALVEKSGNDERTKQLMLKLFNESKEMKQPKTV